MILVDEALRRRADEGRPVRVAMVGAGFMARGVARQIARSAPGLELVAIANRTIAKAVDVFAHAGRPDAATVATVAELERAIDAGRAAVTEDATLVCAAANVDVILEATGAIEFGAFLITSAIDHAKDVVSMNAELDATIGPILQRRARSAGTVLTGCDGDQPAVQMNLIRFVRSIGLTPLVSGNVKGLQDRYRTPATQAAYAAAWGQTPEMVTSFADGTKISFEQALVANAAGMTIARTGMLGPEFDGHVDDLRARYLDEVGLDRLVELGGIVDYVVGAAPSPGVFVFGSNDDPEREIYLRYGKLGDGPLYSFYVPYHLTALEVPISLARVALFRDDVVTSRPVAPRVDVVAFAKRDLRVGETIDGIGGFMTYGACVEGAVVRSTGLLPVGLAEGARLVRDVPKDRELTRDDVELARDRRVVRLRDEQDRLLVEEGP